jgi:F0F1-type ATP synthase beta subunit
MIIDGELDHLPESAFNLKGTLKKLSKLEKKCWQKLKK